MSLDFDLMEMREVSVFDANITHNLTRMATEAGLYACLWRPLEHGYGKGRDIIEPLQRGLALLKGDPVRFRFFNAENGWGTYEDFCEFVAKVLKACEANPDANISISR